MASTTNDFAQLYVTPRQKVAREKREQLEAQQQELDLRFAALNAAREWLEQLEAQQQELDLRFAEFDLQFAALSVEQENIQQANKLTNYEECHEYACNKTKRAVAKLSLYVFVNDLLPKELVWEIYSYVAEPHAPKKDIVVQSTMLRSMIKCDCCSVYDTIEKIGVWDMDEKICGGMCLECVNELDNLEPEDPDYTHPHSVGWYRNRGGFPRLTAPGLQARWWH
jgi:hypothetical protein